MSSTVVASERYALRVIHQVGVALPETIGKEMGFSTEYAGVLCRSLWKGGYITGTGEMGYELTAKGEEFVAQLEK